MTHSSFILQYVKQHETADRINLQTTESSVHGTKTASASSPNSLPVRASSPGTPRAAASALLSHPTARLYRTRLKFSHRQASYPAGTLKFQYIVISGSVADNKAIPGVK